MITSNEYCIAEDTTFFSKGFLEHRLWLGQAEKPQCTSSERAASILPGLLATVKVSRARGDSPGHTGAHGVAVWAEWAWASPSDGAEKTQADSVERPIWSISAQKWG